MEVWIQTHLKAFELSYLVIIFELDSYNREDNKAVAVLLSKTGEGPFFVPGGRTTLIPYILNAFPKLEQHHAQGQPWAYALPQAVPWCAWWMAACHKPKPRQQTWELLNTDVTASRGLAPCPGPALHGQTELVRENGTVGSRKVKG